MTDIRNRRKAEWNHGTNAFNWTNSQSETNKVKNSTIIAQYERGGLKMPDINTTLLTQRIKWVHRFLNENEHGWKHICNWQLEQVGGATIFENTSINIDAIKGFKMMEFYKSMVISYII